MGHLGQSSLTVAVLVSISLSSIADSSIDMYQSPIFTFARRHHLRTDFLTPCVSLTELTINEWYVILHDMTVLLQKPEKCFLVKKKKSTYNLLVYECIQGNLMLSSKAFTYLGNFALRDFSKRSSQSLIYMF